MAFRVTKTGAAPERKLVAVIGTNGSGLYTPATDAGSRYISGRSYSVAISVSIQDILNADRNRVPVYEGDSVTIQF